MRRILTSVVLLVLLFPSLALGETVKLRDLVVTEGLFYKKFTDVPFTGKVTGRGQGKLKKGVQVGPWVTYHKNGQLWSKGTYKNEKRDGPWVIYYETGRLQTKGTQQDGEWDGPYVLYHENGQLKSKGNWKNGGLAGPWVFYLPNGQLSWEGTYKDDVKISD